MAHKQNIKKVASIIFWLAIFLLIAGIFAFADNGYVPLNKARQIKTNPIFTGTLSASDTDVQKALETIDALSYESPLTFLTPLSRLLNEVSIAQATGSVNGYLSNTDWTTFNNKISPNTSPTLTGLTLTGFEGVLRASSGTVTTTFASSTLAGSLTDETGTGFAVFGTSPYLTTPNLGDATGTRLSITTLADETLQNGSFSSNCDKWLSETGFSCNSNTVIRTYYSGIPAVLQQAASNFLLPAVGNIWYKFTYTVSAVSGIPTANITTSFALVSTPLTLTAGTQTTYFKSALLPANFRVDSVTTPGQEFTLDDFSLKQITGGNVITNDLYVTNIDAIEAIVTNLTVTGTETIGSLTISDGLPDINNLDVTGGAGTTNLLEVGGGISLIGGVGSNRNSPGGTAWNGGPVILQAGNGGDGGYNNDDGSDGGNGGSVISGAGHGGNKSGVQDIQHSSGIGGDYTIFTGNAGGDDGGNNGHLVRAGNMHLYTGLGSGISSIRGIMFLNEYGGNVGINQIDPQYQLDVNGDIRSSSNVYADYLFQAGREGSDGSFKLYSEQDPTDYTASINPNSAMASDANFYLPADEPAGTYLLNMTTGGIIGYDSNTYLTTEVDGLTTNELPTAGTAIDVSGTEVSFDSTEVNDTTWGDNSDVSMLWTFNQSTGTDPTLTFSSGGVAIGGNLSATNLSGSNTGDNTVATSGDSATAFFSSGTVESNYGGTGQDSLGWTGRPRVSSGTWSTSNIDISSETNLAVSVPVTLTDDTVGLGYNTTNLKLTSNNLNTIQDLANTSSPTFLNETLTGNIINTATTSLNPAARGTVFIGTDNEPFNVYVQGGYAYTANAGAGTMSIVDISNPDSPVIVGTVTGLGVIYSIHIAGRYAYCTNATTNTLKIVDISNPSTASIVGSVATFNLPSYVFVQGPYAYVVNSDALGGDKYLQIINVANPVTPISVGIVALQSTGATSVYVVGRYAYVVTQGSLYPAGDTFEIYDVSNPAAPTLVNTNYTNLSAGVGTHTAAGTSTTVLTDSAQSWTTNSLVGMIIHNVTDTAYGQITANDSVAHTITSTILSNSGQWNQNDTYSIEYTANAGTHTGGTSSTTMTDSSKSWTVDYFIGSEVYNITDGTSATITANTISTITTSGITWDNDDTYVINSPLSPNPFSVVVQGSNAYITLTALNKLNIYDVSDPAIPALVSSTSTTETLPLTVRVAGRYVIVANYGGGIQIFDAVNASLPVSVGNVVTGCPQGIFTQGKYVYDVDYCNSMLRIFELNGLETTSALIHSLEAGDLGVRGDARIGNNMWLGGGLITGSGGIKTDGDVGVKGTTELIGTTTVTGAIYANNTTTGNIILGGAGGATLQTSRPALRSTTGFSLVVDSPGSTILNIDTDQSGVNTAFFAIRANTSTTNLFKIDELGNTFVTPPSAQTIAGGDTITANACGGLKQITSASGVTTNTTNTFTAPASTNTGCSMDVINTGANNITLDNNANFVSNGAADVVLEAGDTCRVSSNGTTWYQIGATGNN